MPALSRFKQYEIRIMSMPYDWTEVVLSELEKGKGRKEETGWDFHFN